MTITQAMIMAAGHATRMRPLTNNLPKPLLEVHGKPLLTHIIDHLVAENVTKIVITGHHAIEPLRDYMATLPTLYPDCEFILSEEDKILETGGGLINALPYLNHDQPFYMINGDAFWVNHPSIRILKNLSDQWDQTHQKLMMLLQPCQSIDLTSPVGDYDLSKDGIATRSLDRTGAYMFAGVRICHPDILKDYKVEKFSFLEIMDAQDQINHLNGLAHKGQWYHISTPEDLQDVNALYNKR